jgi:hypothetical protein
VAGPAAEPTAAGPVGWTDSMQQFDQPLRLITMLEEHVAVAGSRPL